MIRVCFIGIGSIAKRHILNLASILSEEKTGFRIDAVRRSPDRNGIEDLPIDGVYSSIPANAEYDAVFVTNPTEFHLDALSAARGKAGAYFIEKPVVSVKNAGAARSDPYYNSDRCYVACPLRYKKVIGYLKEHLPEWDVNGVRAICSSYLPDWRPGVDYRSVYSARKELGGGVSIDLIHEWDYLRYLFGSPEKVLMLSGKKSGLEIDSDDSAVYIAEYPEMFAELHLDYYGRKPLREVTVFTSRDTVRVDLIGNTVEYLLSGETVSFEETRDDFQKAELLHFLEIMRGKPSDNTISDAVATLMLTQGSL